MFDRFLSMPLTTGLRFLCNFFFEALESRVEKGESELTLFRSALLEYWENWALFCTVQKVSIFGVFLVRIFIHSDCRDLFWKLRIQLECRKIRTRNTSNADTFYTILDTNKPSISIGERMVVLIHSRHKNLWDALHDLVQFVKFKKAWKTPMEEYYFW